MSSPARTQDRMKAVLADDTGYSDSEMDKILLLDDETILHHIHDYCSKNKITPENGGSASH